MYYFQVETFRDSENREVEHYRLHNYTERTEDSPLQSDYSDMEPMRPSLTFLPALRPTVDFKYAIVLDMPVPVAQGPMGIPIMAVTAIRVPLPDAENLKDAFEQFDDKAKEIQQEIQKSQEEAQKKAQSELVVANEVPNVDQFGAL